VLSAPVMRALSAPGELRAHDAPEFVVPSAGAEGKPPESVTEKPEANEVSRDKAREETVISEIVDRKHGRRRRVSHSEAWEVHATEL
jgi:hypothetical protein